MSNDDRLSWHIDWRCIRIVIRIRRSVREGRCEHAYQCEQQRAAAEPPCPGPLLCSRARFHLSHLRGVFPFFRSGFEQRPV